MRSHSLRINVSITFWTCQLSAPRQNVIFLFIKKSDKSFHMGLYCFVYLPLLTTKFKFSNGSFLIFHRLQNLVYEIIDKYHFFFAITTLNQQQPIHDQINSRLQNHLKFLNSIKLGFTSCMTSQMNFRFLMVWQRQVHYIFSQIAKIKLKMKIIVK